MFRVSEVVCVGMLGVILVCRLPEVACVMLQGVLISVYAIRSGMCWYVRSHFRV